MVPGAMAAAEPQRNADGMAQKLGKKASRPAEAIENRKREGTVPQSALLSTSKAAAVAHSGIEKASSPNPPPLAQERRLPSPTAESRCASAVRQCGRNANRSPA